MVAWSSSNASAWARRRLGESGPDAPVSSGCWAAPEPIMSERARRGALQSLAAHCTRRNQDLVTPLSTPKSFRS